MLISDLTIVRRLALAACALSMGLFLAACSDSDDKSKDAAKATTETTTTTEAKPADAAKTDTKAETKTDTAAATPAKPAVDVPASEGSVDVAKLMEPGPLEEAFIGKVDAPVTIVEYMSMTCPHCARFHAETFDGIKTKYVDTGKVRFILREYPLDLKATAAIMLARCAPKEQYFSLVAALFHSQITWATADDTRGALLQMAKLAGFTQESFNACLTNQKLLDDVNAVRSKADKEFGVQSTPTFFINGDKFSGEMTVDQMSAIIDSKL